MLIRAVCFFVNVIWLVILSQFSLDSRAQETIVDIKSTSVFGNYFTNYINNILYV